MILTTGRVIKKIKKENENKVVNKICPIFRFATQTFNGGSKRKMNTDKRWASTYARMSTQQTENDRLLKRLMSLLGLSRPIPRGSEVIALSVRWASRAFVTKSRLLRISSKGIRRTSLIEWSAWEGLCCKPKYRANIIHHFIFVLFLYFFYHSSCRKDQFTVLSLKFGIS